MSNRIRRSRKLISALTSTLALLLVPAAAAQNPMMTTSSPTTPGEWSAWLGCWEPVETRTRSILPSIAGTARRLVCVLPTENPTTVDITTIANSQVVNQVRVDASGTKLPVSHEGCNGWERATWSTDRRRVYLSSDLTCAGDVQRSTSGVLSLVPGGDWLDVQSVTIAGQTTTRAKRYRAVRPTPALSARLPHEVAAALATSQSLAARTARQAAARPHSLEAVIEAAQQLEVPVTTAWLIELAQSFTISAKELRQLAAARVPEPVIDLLVALAYPAAYAIDRIPAPDRPVVSLAPPTNQPGVGVRLPPRLIYHDWDWDPFFGWYGLSTGIYYPYYYHPYDLRGFGSGWYTGPRPVTIVVRDKADRAAATQPGRVVKGRGYTRGRGAGSNPPTTRVTRPDRSAGAAATPTPAGTNSGTTTRKAKPRNQE